MNEPTIGSNSPWGTVDNIERVCPGIVFVFTSSHGGVWVASRLMNLIPLKWRTTNFSPGQWFEEDCDWCIPFVYLADIIRKTGDDAAEQALNAAPKCFEQYHNRKAVTA
jgi:hypothetical protein